MTAAAAKTSTWWAFERADGSYATGPLGAPVLVDGAQVSPEELAGDGEKPVLVRLAPVRGKDGLK